ncbi:MAG: flagellar basal body P-ring formation protein FlgA [bacterium]|nr:flagellar basal body P-ring formation protein FlgA [bacterium]
MRRPGGWTIVAVVLAVGVGPNYCAAGQGACVRLWPSAVVVEEEVRVGSLCELTGFDSALHERLRDLVIVPSPPPGGSKAVTLDELRSFLAGAGVNMAETIVKGAAECGVSRPRVLPIPSATDVPAEHVKTGQNSPAPTTLRKAIIDYFEAELSRYEGRVEVDFGRTAAAWLDLAGPEYTFGFKRKTSRPLGLIDLEVHVLREGQRVQQIELQPVVAFKRNVVVARRAINQKAVIRADDVRVTEMSFDRLDKLGLADATRAVGQRAKRFVPPGTLLNPRDLETVPLVKRGQLVEVYSTVGGVSVVTAAKAVESGGHGDTIELRDPKRRGRHMFGVVTGARRVELLSKDEGYESPVQQRLARAGGE